MGIGRGGSFCPDDIQTRPKRHQWERPSDRVRRALFRLSKGKWLSAKECHEIAYRLARCCSAAPSHVVNAVWCGPMQAVGLLDGLPPAFIDDHDYGKFVVALNERKRKSPTDLSPEFAILNLMLKRKVRHGR